MAILRPLFAAAVLAATIPAAPALAHESGYGNGYGYGSSSGYGYYDRHARDHTQHRRFHGNVGRAHERAHEEGFYSGGEHRAYHRALRDLHGGFHYRHPDTRHDHYRW